MDCFKAYDFDESPINKSNVTYTCKNYGAKTYHFSTMDHQSSSILVELMQDVINMSS